MRAQEVHERKRGNVLVPPFLKGREPFIAGRRLDNHKLIIFISSIGFT
jgi:hypothetical protein